MRGKMDGSRDVVLLQGLLQDLTTTEIGFHDGAPLGCPAMACREVVIDNWLNPNPRQSFGRMASNITRTTCDENPN